MKIAIFISGSILFAVLFACSSESVSEKKTLAVKSRLEYQELVINSHKAYLEKEKRRIDHFVDSLGIDFTATQSGLRFAVLSSSNSEDSLIPGDVAVIDYTLTLLNGDTAYQSIVGKPQEFIVNMDNVEAGLHEGVQKLAVGDRAILILPAHLAHGITGDQAAIPIQSPVVYYLSLLAKK